MKKYMKYMFVVAMLTTSINVFSQTTTVTFKPNATVGKDAVIRTDFSIYPRYSETNYGNIEELSMTSIPIRDVSIMSQSLIRFDQLNTIPVNARIVSAILTLYGVPNSLNFPLGNTTSGNPLYIQRITSAWDENAVTWFTQPSVVYTNAISVPSATSQWNWHYTINSTPNSAPQLINMLNTMKGNSNNNWGFMISGESSDRAYLGTLFASSDNRNPALWPELTVTYEIINCDFTTCVSTMDQNLYTFSAVNTYGNHIWNLYDENWNIISTFSSPSFSFNLSSGSYYIEHNVSTESQSCSSSIGLCVDQSQLLKSKQKKNGIINDGNTQIDIRAKNSIKVYPNPSSDDWNVTLTSENAESVDVIITDCVGKIVSTYKKNITKGDNNFVIDGSKLPKGIYVLSIKGENTNFTQKLSKN